MIEYQVTEGIEVTQTGISRKYLYLYRAGKNQHRVLVNAASVALVDLASTQAGSKAAEHFSGELRELIAYRVEQLKAQQSLALPVVARYAQG